MEELYTCVACDQRFRVLSRPDQKVGKQHEIEMNVECPSCCQTNAIVWPQDGSLPSVLREDGRPSQRELEMLTTAKRLIAGQIGVIEASRTLGRFRPYDARPQIAVVLLVFVGIDSETDTLPIGAVRKEWNRHALESKDREIAKAEELYRETAANAAAELIRLLSACT